MSRLCHLVVIGLLVVTSSAFAGKNGANVPTDQLRTKPTPRPSGWIHVYSPNFREEVEVNIYGKGGAFNQASLAALDHVFRCKRSDEERAVDPRLYVILSLVYDHFGKKRVELVSGYRKGRSPSRHHHASAMDIRIEGVPWRKVYAYVATLDGGGMGIGRYPHSGFVHVDYRAPGAPSYRWTDYGGRAHHRRKSKRKPNS